MTIFPLDWGDGVGVVRPIAPEGDSGQQKQLDESGEEAGDKEGDFGLKALRRVIHDHRGCHLKSPKYFW